MELLVQKILLQCERDEDSGCLIWSGRMSNGCPKICGPRPGAEIGDLMCRRVIWEATSGEAPKQGKRIIMTCRDKHCLEFAHMAARTNKQIALLAAKEGKFSSIERRVRIAAGRRRNSKLDYDKVADIRACSTAAEAARKHGINKTMASKIRRGESWAPLPGASIFNSLLLQGKP